MSCVKLSRVHCKWKKFTSLLWLLFVQSFRFGAEIAYVGATILKVCKGVQKILVGGKQKGKYTKQFFFHVFSTY